MYCPRCGESADGAYCAACGAPQHGAACRGCGTALGSGARFCTACGAAAGVEARSNVAWYVAGASLAVLILVLLFPVLRPAPGVNAFQRTGAIDAPPGGALTGGTAGAPMQTGPLTGTIREQADRLFNRVMQARSEGDQAQAEFFLPMALTAYHEAGPLDHDGLYHLSILEHAAGNAAGALATAQRILADEPKHLLALGIAAEAALDAGNTDAARGFYRRILDSFEAEQTRDLPEYLDHARIMPEYRDAARQFLRN
jgi:tetratricopeptide (TPR) repeat protein